MSVISGWDPGCDGQGELIDWFPALYSSDEQSINNPHRTIRMRRVKD